MNKQLLERLISLRQELHKHPEVSGQEAQTAKRIKQFIAQYKPDEIIENIGTYGLAFVFDSKKEGPVTLFRSELDALPIEEINNFPWKSTVPEASHKCGHDGHMVMIAGLADYLHNNPPKHGKVILMYQPEEETGTGALRMLQDEKFTQLNPDYVFALHNLPNVPLGEIRCRDDVFAAASVGMIVRLKGKTSHAAQPEKGISPALAMSEIIQMLESLVSKTELSDFALITPVFARLGEKAFGTTPDYAEVMATIRSYRNQDLDKLKKTAAKQAEIIAENYRLSVEFEWVEEFSASINQNAAVEMIKTAAIENELNYHQLAEPNRWSEDFGYFLEKYPGAIFGLGAGLDMPELHNPDYDFPEGLIPHGTNIFQSIIKQINQ
jgi:amidohydrolase